MNPRNRPPGPGRGHRPGAVLVAAGVLLASLAACSPAEEAAPATTTEAPLQGTIELDTVPQQGCDDLQSRHCLLPFPSDATTKAAGTPTGRRVAFPDEQTPRNADGRTVDPLEWNRSDGFSPGTPILVWVPTVDLARSGAATLADLSASVADTSPVVIVDADTGELWPHWVEIDANASSEFTRLLIIRPARNFVAGHRYVVGLRNLVDRGGETLRPSDVFLAYRDRLDTGEAVIEARRPHMEEVLATLAEAGVSRGNLWLAWDFTVASVENTTGRMLHLRDDAFAELADSAPTFEVTEVEEPTGDQAEQVARFVEGTFEVPLYLTGEGEPGSRMILDPDGQPIRNTEAPTFTASFRCTVPASAVAEGSDPALPVVYGHGLLGSRDEVGASNIRRITHEQGLMYCATDWIGMSEADVGNAIVVLADLSLFPTLADRVQQGILNTLFLGRLMIHPDGLGSDPAFQVEGRSFIDTSTLAYDGNSQGGIIGGAATAVATDWERAVLGVPGMNYSTLLRRSTDFDAYAAVLEPSYPDELERALALAMIQMLWDRAETNGYAAHLGADPLPGTPPHRVLMHVAFGDFQVADITAFVLARTMGARYQAPLLAEGRGFADYAYGLEPVEDDPHEGSVLVLWDSGVPAPPMSNTPPRGQGDPAGVHDPHEDPRAMPAAQEQKARFLREGVVVDVCSGAPCIADRVD